MQIGYQISLESTGNTTRYYVAEAEIPTMNPLLERYMDRCCVACGIPFPSAAALL